MSRLFVPGDRVDLAAGACAAIGAGDMAFVCLVRLTSNFSGLMTTQQAAATRFEAWSEGGSGAFTLPGGFDHGPALNVSRWFLLGFDRVHGSTHGRWHWVELEGPNVGIWTHVAATGGSTPDWSTPLDLLRIGDGSVRTGSFRGAAFALYDKTFADVAGWENQLGFAAASAWKAAGPKGMWLLNQAVVTDPVLDVTGGGADQTSRTGTAVDASEPPGWSYTLGPVTAVLPAAAETDSASSFTETIAVTLPVAATTTTASSLVGAVSKVLPTAVELDVAMPLIGGGGGLQPVQTGPCSWDIDTTCCGKWSTFSAPIQTFASAFAKKILWALSGRRYGACQLDLRPCKKAACSGQPPGGWWSAGPMWTPMINPQGVWINSCGCLDVGDDCSCSVEQQVNLPGPVASVLSVMVDGVAVPSTAYVVYDFKQLVRTDGGTWPVCQDFTADVDEPGSFLVSYLRGVAVPSELACLTGVLACEIGKLCAGDKTCRLPRSVASVARQGVNVDFVPLETILKLRITGIPEIDMWLNADNPDRLAADTVVWSPDVKPGRIRTS